MQRNRQTKANLTLHKTQTGIIGLDEITGGGLPTGRPTLISGGPGCGKTLLALEFLVRGASHFNEPGVFVAFEEQADELAANVNSLGFDIESLVSSGMLILDYIHIERSEIEETGEYDLEGLFIRLAHAIQTIGAKRVVLDTIEALFAGLPNHAIIRAELRRLFRWLKDRGMTAVITGEKGELSLTRYGLEEYVADCVVTLDHRVNDQISTRRLRVVKYRGTSHGTNEYPFIISDRGISVLPITSLQLDHEAPTERILTGIPRLDDMLEGKGVYRGSSVLVTGSPGTGKSSIGAKFAETVCRRGERTLIFAYEESPAQMIRNMKSIGINLGPWVKKGLLQIHSSRPTMQGLEQHLVMMHDTVMEFQPALVVVDPISNLTLEQHHDDAKPTLMRLIDFLKRHQITSVFTSLTSGSSPDSEDSNMGVSSLMDTWFLLRNVELNGERNRTLYVLKSRGMSHSNQVREFLLSAKGINLVDVHLGAASVLTGASRLAQEARNRSAAELQRQAHEREMRQLAVKQKALDAQIAALQAEAEAAAAELQYLSSQQSSLLMDDDENMENLAAMRGVSYTQSGKKRNP